MELDPGTLIGCQFTHVCDEEDEPDKIYNADLIEISVRRTLRIFTVAYWGEGRLKDDDMLWDLKRKEFIADICFGDIIYQ